MEKFIDTMKYYQSSLEKLSETLSKKEKENITKLTIQFYLNMIILQLFGKIYPIIKEIKSLKLL